MCTVNVPKYCIQESWTSQSELTIYMSTDLGSDWISHIYICLHSTNIKWHGIIAHDGA